MIDSSRQQMSATGTVSLIAAMAFLIAGLLNITHAAHAAEVLHIRGLTQLGRLGAGVSEIAGAAGLLVRRTRFATAFALTSLMVGAILIYMLKTRGNLVLAIVLVTLTTAVGWMSGTKTIN